MERLDIENVLKLTKIGSELELEQATSLFNRLRLSVKNDPSLKAVRNHLADLIEAYEAEHWSAEDLVTDEQVKSSDVAERIVQFQNQFIQQRKALIKGQLKKFGLTQNDLAAILGHRKNYVSELVNGVRPLSKDDSVVINRVLGIGMSKLIEPIINEEDADRIRGVFRKLNNPKLKLREDDLQLELV